MESSGVVWLGRHNLGSSFNIDASPRDEIREFVPEVQLVIARDGFAETTPHLHRQAPVFRIAPGQRRVAPRSNGALFQVVMRKVRGMPRAMVASATPSISASKAVE